MSASGNWRTTNHTHLLRSPSSENGLDTPLTLDLPRSTFHEPGDGTGGLDDLPTASLGRFRLRRPGEPGECLPDCRMSVMFT
jgi:hypothetical protein